MTSLDIAHLDVRELFDDRSYRAIRTIFEQVLASRSPYVTNEYAAVMTPGAAPRYFTPADLPSRPLDMGLLAEWSRTLAQAARITLASMGQREIATSVTELGAAACGDQGVGVVVVAAG